MPGSEEEEWEVVFEPDADLLWALLAPDLPADPDEDQAFNPS